MIVRRMDRSDILDAVGIWATQYRAHCGPGDAFPRIWAENPSEIAAYLERKVDCGNAIVAKDGDKLVGYLAYDEFPFHGEKSVCCPAIGHAVREERKEQAYLCLYECISKLWVERGISNHMWTVFYGDARLRSILFDLGFGSYLVDAFASVKHTVDTDAAQTISRARPEDVDALFDLVEESRLYYRSAPIFLKREPYSRDSLLKLLHDNGIFIAWEANHAIGFVHVSVSQTDDIICLSPENIGLIDEIGIYIKPECRGRGLGRELMRHVLAYCNSHQIGSIHVDFETANPFANKFWRKHCQPMLLSLRRTINKDIND